MIPFSILSGQLLTEGNNIQEISILDVSRIGFPFRVPKSFHKSWDAIRLQFYCRKDSAYREVVLRDVFCEMQQETEFFVVYRVETNQPDYKAAVTQLMAEYSQYISLKLEEDAGTLAQTWAGYPAQMDDVFAPHWDAQRHDWFSGMQPDAAWRACIPKLPPLAVALDRPELWEKYIALPDSEFFAWYWALHGLGKHPISRMPVRYVYVGSAYCPRLFPQPQALCRLVHKARRENLQPVLVTSMLREHDVPRAQDWLRHLPEQRMELVCNDWGMMELVKQAGHVPVCGTLLNKRRKDARLAYKTGMAAHRDQLRQTAVQASFYRAWLRRTYGVETISFEACGYVPDLTPNADVYAPFYQTNTAGHCTLYAVCHNGSRGRQTAEDDCPQYCRERVFLYPDHLHMIGRYNSLFGADLRILTDGAYLDAFLSQKPRRLVINLL